MSVGGVIHIEPLSESQCLRNAGYLVAPWYAKCEAADEIMDLGQVWANSPEVANANEEFQVGRRRAGLKDFLVKYRDPEHWTVDHPLIRFAIRPELLKLVCAALSVDDNWTPAHLQSANIWAVLPSEGKPKIYSQSFHRDPEDTQLIKMFLYLSEVNDESGPFQYIVGSHRGDFDACDAMTYPKPEQLGRIPMDRCLTFTGPPGTVVIANTSGLHRGGYGSKLRVNAAWTYTTSKGDRPRFTLPAPPENATPLQRYALGFGD